MDICSRCKKRIPAPTQPSGGTGYGYTAAGDMVYYACCADLDKEHMVKHGVITLYLTNVREHRELGWRNGQWSGDVSNWPGSLSFPNRNVKVGGHNWAGRRYDVWFIGPDLYMWHGVRYGDETEIVHCRRTKQYCGPTDKGQSNVQRKRAK